MGDMLENIYMTKSNLHMIKRIATLYCKHPGREEVISLSKVKMIKADKIEVSGLWVNKDNEGNLQKGSVLADFLIFMGVKTIGELKGTEVDTVYSDAENKFLAIKGYK